MGRRFLESIFVLFSGMVLGGRTRVMNIFGRYSEFKKNLQFSFITKA